MNRLGLRSIRFKLFASLLLTTIFALALSGLLIVWNDLRDYHSRLREDLKTQANLLGLASAPALQFNDRKLAEESLAVLRARPQIVAAALYSANGALFASYTAPEHAGHQLPQLPEPDGAHEDGESLMLFQRIVDHNEIIGTIYLNTPYRPLDRVWQYTGIVGAVMVLTLIASMLLSLRAQATITRPILGVTGVARRITLEKSYDLRAEKTTSDEIAWLVDAFNDLLAEIARRSAALESSNAQLQQQMREREAADRALQESELRYRTLVTTLTTVVWSANANGEFASIQPPWAEYTGQTPPQHMRFGWLQAFHEHDRPVLEIAFARARLEPRPLNIDAQLWHAQSKTYRHINLRAVPLFDAEGQLREWIGTANDIDDQTRAAMEIQRLNTQLEQRVAERTAELERANKELEAFSYSVSHDLRTPLRAIDGFSQALLEDYADKLDDAGLNFLQRVRSGAQRMGQLIDDLLKLSRVSRSTLLQENVDLSAMAHEIASDLRAREPERAMTIVIAPQLKVVGDSQLLRIALENLLNNAWKYTGRREHARIEFGYTHADAAPCYFVRDNGAGFNMAYADKLFGAFQRLHDAKEFAGTGVGLATVQRIIDRHGGRIWADAQVDHGATFYFTLPSKADMTHEYATDPVSGR